MEPMTRRQMLALCSCLAAAAPAAYAQPLKMQIVKDPGCGCCEQWVAHLKTAGISATVTESASISALKDAKGIPKAARSCHTGTIGGYVFEGHVPVEVVTRVLKERPAIVGVAVPGMPIGSPGMEIPSGQVQPYDVLSFDKAGRTRVFASYGRRSL